MNYNAKDPQVSSRQLKVQKLSIPFLVVGSAGTSTTSNDEPAVLFIRTQDTDQITTASGALASGETATYSVAAADATGIFNILVKTNEAVAKVVSARIASRIDGVSHPVFLGDADGLTSLGNMMLTCDSTVDFTAANTLDASLEVEYVVAE